MKQENRDQYDAPKSDAVLGIVVLALVVSIWLGGWLLIDRFVTTSDKAITSIEVARGVFGDKFGAINALFAGLAFAGIIWTLLLQRRDLRDQRREIAETKREMATQNETLRRQRFENTLFHLLALHTGIVEKLQISSNLRRDAFNYFIELTKLYTPEFRVFHALRKLSRDEYHQLRSNKAIPDSALPKLDEDEKEALTADIASNALYIGKFEDKDLTYHASLINKAYAVAHEKSRDGLSHYFRNLYNIFKFIDDATDIDDDHKRNYGRIVRAQLSDEELVVIFYNCIVIVNGENVLELGYPKMTRLVSHYDILQNLNSKNLIHDIHLEIYSMRVKEANK